MMRDMTSPGDRPFTAPGTRTMLAVSMPVPEELMREAADLVLRGGVVGYPTETVYGIGGDPTDTGVIRRIHSLKGRSERKSFLLLAGSGTELSAYVEDVPEAAVRLMDAFWPGPVTLIFRASPRLPAALTGPDKKIGFRISPDPVCAALLRALGMPLISTSANPTGKPPARSAQETLRYFPGGLDAVIDGGERPESMPSTVVDVTRSVPLLMRAGPVSAETIRSVTGKLDEHETV
jgi:L-threonylcarbamoyladenylate synthase